MEAVGVPETVRSEYMQKLGEKAISFDPEKSFADAKVEEDEEKGSVSVADSTTLLSLLSNKELTDARERHERERDLPPTKVAQVTKSQLPFLFSDFTPDQASSNVKQTFISTRPVHSTTTLSDLVESA